MQVPKILIVDDEKEIRLTLKEFLASRIEGDFLEAGTGQEALQHLKKESIDLVFLDIGLPGLSGLDVLNEAKKINPNLTILVISAWDGFSIVEEAIKSGALDYIPKPTSLKVIEMKTKDLLTKIGKYYPKKS